MLPQSFAGTVKAHLAHRYGWIIFSVPHLILCYPHVLIVDLEMKIVTILRMWLCLVLLRALVSA